MPHTTLLLLLTILSLLYSLTQALHVQQSDLIRITSVPDFPEFEMGDKVEFYFIEGVFPYTTPSEIRNEMGEMWNRYSLSHAGLGLWNKDTNVKYSLEIVCLNYSAALFPKVVNNETMEWYNDATIVMTSPIQEELWSESRLVSVSNGAAYECIRTYLLDNYQKKFAVYQPVSVNAYAPTTEDHVGEASIPFLDSYKFTFDLLQELANYGVQLDAFLGVERTGWSYLAETDESPQPPSPQNANANVASIVHQGSVFSSALGDDAILPSITELKWAEGDPVPTNVTEWYADLEDCYRVLFESGMGGSSILSSLNSCYQSGHAFVYASASSVYQIKLAQSIQGGKLKAYYAPVLWRHDEDLPSESTESFVGWDLTDTLVSSITILCLFTGLGYFLYTRCCRTTPRRRASKMWEEQATITVQNVINGQGEGSIDNSLDRDYFNHENIDNSQRSDSGLFSHFSSNTLYGVLGMREPNADSQQPDDCDRSK